MASPTKRNKTKRPSLFDGLEIGPSTLSHRLSGPVNLAESLCRSMRSTLRLGEGTVCARSLRGVETHFTIAMDSAYDYKILHQEFDPEAVFPEIVALGNQLSEVLQSHLTSEQEAAFEDHILDCLARMVYGSNMIERAGAGSQITLKLCHAIFRGEKIPEDIGETDEEFLTLKQSLVRNNLPADTSAVLRSRREIVQHAKAAAYIVNQLCIRGQDLSEEIILETHRILTYRVDAESTPWTEYSGVYRSAEVSAGLHPFPHPLLVPHLMKAMIGELEFDLKKAMDSGTIDPIAMAAKYTHAFVNIHPFIDGNGRMCRLILNTLLLKLGSFFVSIGEGQADREVYLDIATNASALEDMYQDAEDEEKPKLYKELSSFVLVHVKRSMSKLIKAVAR
ncbi:uncharacterized protein PFLUO_LOCUS8651 [Penicillium psychrofluorescens]|uniref:uncharacterized protein n=1 Tax=Penicillium psychrofluorescens TaxID=3158075 RepID=UPI003CCE2C0C